MMDWTKYSYFSHYIYTVRYNTGIVGKIIIPMVMVKSGEIELKASYAYPTLILPNTRTSHVVTIALFSRCCIRCNADRCDPFAIRDCGEKPGVACDIIKNTQ